MDFPRLRYSVTFTSWPTNPRENNWVQHDGHPALDSFECSTDQATGTGASCTVADLNTAQSETDITEYALCSNRGTCDFGSGACTCHDGFFGHACHETNLVYTNDGTSTQPAAQYFATSTQVCGWQNAPLARRSWRCVLATRRLAWG